MFKKIVLTVAAASLFVIPSIALSDPDITNLLQNAETDDLTMYSGYDMAVVQAGNAALGGTVKNSMQNITGDDLDMDMYYATGVVQAANLLGGKKIKNVVQNASFDAVTMTSDSNLLGVQAINAATSCVYCDENN
ncbi:hypothetical protein VU04_03690 [Desulfobulbus sp. TB]|nr:hypothetical protein [Desulfobulbus sp. TB]